MRAVLVHVYVTNLCVTEFSVESLRLDLRGKLCFGGAGASRVLLEQADDALPEVAVPVPRHDSETAKVVGSACAFSVSSAGGNRLVAVHENDVESGIVDRVEFVFEALLLHEDGDSNEARWRNTVEASS